MTTNSPITTIEGDGLARAAFNALAFIPKLAKDQFIRVTVTPTEIEFAGSDGYAAGKDIAPLSNGRYAVFAISRDDLADLEAFGRAWKKKVIAVDFRPGQIAFLAEEALVCEILPPHAEAWILLDRIFEATQVQAEPWFGAAAFDPQLLGRFAKVKSPVERVADFLFVGPEKPVLVKVGPTFRGLVMPVYREQAAEYSPEGLW